MPKAYMKEMLDEKTTFSSQNTLHRRTNKKLAINLRETLLVRWRVRLQGRDAAGTEMEAES